MALIEDTVLTAPAGLGWVPPIRPIYKNKKWVGHIPARSLIPAAVGVTYYVDPALGNDNYAGTALKPLRNIGAALRKSNVGLVYLAPSPNASFDDGQWGNPAIITSSAHVIIKPWNIRMGRPTVTNAWAHQETNWVVERPYPKVYTAARSMVTGVVDMVGGLHGEPVFYARTATLGECNARPGTYYFTSSKVSVNTLNGAVPSRSLKVFIGQLCAQWSSSRPLYIEGIDFVGGNDSFEIVDRAGDVILIDCGAYCATGGNGFSINTAGVAILENCRSDFHKLDAFNYHKPASYNVGKVLEINCKSTHSGVLPTTSNQSSTTHDGIISARYGCQYTGAANQLIADVTAGTKSWNVGLRLGSSRNDGGTSIGYNGSDTESWFYDCDFGSSTWSLIGGGAETLYLDNSIASTSSGNIQAYTQA